MGVSRDDTEGDASPDDVKLLDVTAENVDDLAPDVVADTDRERVTVADTDRVVVSLVDNVRLPEFVTVWEMLSVWSAVPDGVTNAETVVFEDAVDQDDIEEDGLGSDDMDSVAVKLDEGAVQPEGERERGPVFDSELVGDADREIVDVTDKDHCGLDEKDAVTLGVPDHAEERDGDRVYDGLGLADGELDTDSVSLADVDGDGDPLTELVTLTEREMHDVVVADVRTERVPLTATFAEIERTGENVLDADFDRSTDRVMEGVIVSVPFGRGVRDSSPETLGDDELDVEAEFAATVGDEDDDDVDVSTFETVRVGLHVRVPDAHADTVLVCELETLNEFENVPVAEADAVFTGTLGDIGGVRDRVGFEFDGVKLARVLAEDEIVRVIVVVIVRHMDVVPVIALDDDRLTRFEIEKEGAAQ